MIRYDAIQNRYLYKMEDIDNIINIIKTGNFYDSNNCTQENISEIARSIEKFISNIEIVPEKVTLERHETEEEAKEYFGKDFITKFEDLLAKLDKQDTVVAIHGTNVSNCPNICDEGLKYKTPSLTSTAVLQDMSFGQEEMHFKNYEKLLNWEHREYKGLVILAIPYECYYKEGLWNHFQETDSSYYGGQDYKIDSDFVVGYIDVMNKEIVMNPKYNREHNYDGYIEDYDIFREQLDMDNDKFRQLSIEVSEQLKEESKLYQENKKDTVEDEDNDFDLSRVPYIIEDLIGNFNSIKYGFPDEMTEDRYNSFLEDLSSGFGEVVKAIPLLKTNDDVKREQDEKKMMFEESIKTSQVEENDNSDDFDWGEFPSEDSLSSDFDNIDWDDDIDWDEDVNMTSKKNI